MAANALHELRDHYRVYRSCETDAVRRSAARPFVQAVQSAMRLPERTNDLAANRRTAASRSHNCDKHDSDHLRMQCIQRRSLTCLEATPTRRPFWFLLRRLPASGLASLPARHVAKWHSVGRRIATACSPRAMVV